MSNKTKNIIGSLIAIIISGVCAYAGSTTNITGMQVWFTIVSVSLGCIGLLCLISIFSDES